MRSLRHLSYEENTEFGTPICPFVLSTYDWTPNALRKRNEQLEQKRRFVSLDAGLSSASNEAFRGR